MAIGTRRGALFLVLGILVALLVLSSLVLFTSGAGAGLAL